MERLTYFDYFCGCYKVKPKAPQGQIVQTLGKYEEDTYKVLEKILNDALEQIAAEKTPYDSIKGEAWRLGYTDGLTTAEEILKTIIERGLKSD